MKSTALVVVGVAGAIALALSIATGAWASSVASPSPTTIYQTYLGTEVINSPMTLLATPLPVGEYHVEVAAAFQIDPSYVTCNLQTMASTDTIIANTGGATVYGSETGEAVTSSLAINGTVSITQSHDRVDVVCSFSGSGETSTAGASLTAQPVDRIKLTKG